MNDLKIKGFVSWPFPCDFCWSTVFGSYIVKVSSDPFSHVTILHVIIFACIKGKGCAGFIWWQLFMFSWVSRCMHHSQRKTLHFIAHYISSCVNRWVVFCETNMSNGNANKRRHLEGMSQDLGLLSPLRFNLSLSLRGFSLPLGELDRYILFTLFTFCFWFRNFWRSVKVFRCQLAHSNPYYSSEPPRRDGTDKPSGIGGRCLYSTSVF